MADYRPETKVYLCEQVPLDDTYSDTLDFADKASQATYFASKATHKYTNLSYQRVNNSIANPRAALTCRVPDLADNLYNCNYMMFQNNNFGTKWFYAFIKQVNYISPECTEIVYEIDYFQTWLFDFNVGVCYVEREHSSTDAPFNNIIPEPVEVTEYVQQVKTFETKDEIWYTLLASADESGGSSGTGLKGGIFSGLYTASATNYDIISKLLAAYTKNGLIYNNSNVSNVLGIIMSRCKVGFEVNKSKIDTGFTSKVDSINGHLVKNKKLLNSQFRYFKCVLATNESMNLSPEKIYGENLTFQKIESPSTSPNIAYIPAYENSSENWNYALVDDEVVQCAWAADSYTQWLQNNQNKLYKSLVESLGKIAVGGALISAGAPAMGTYQIASGIMQGKQIQATAKDKQNAADIGRGNILSGSVSFSNNRPSLTIYEITADLQSLQRADDFMNKYGYSVNATKIPNRKSRTKWNYIQVDSAFVIGSAPVEAVNAIKKALNTGITIWHTTNVGDYGADNEVTGLEGW